MAINKVIDGAQLDADLESIADAIRAKGGTSAPLSFPAGFISAVQAFPSAISVEALAVNANGVYSASSGYAFDPVTVSVPNSYSAADAGKVVSGNALVAQTSSSVTENGTVDTTLINSLEVNVSGGGGDHDAEDGIIARTISGTYENSRVTKIGSYAFASCASLTTVSFPEVTTIGSYAFAYCTSLTTVSFPKVTSIGSFAFSTCTSLATASFPEAKTIESYAFSYCTSLTTVSFPKATSIWGYAFANCSNLATASFPEVKTIGGQAFLNCKSLTTASFPKATSIDTYAFSSCKSLTTVSFPEATTIFARAFANCTRLTTVSFPKATSIGSYAFSSCSSLTTASFPAATTIGSYAFASCYNLISLYLFGSSVPTLSASNAFNSTPIGGYSTSAGQFGSIFVKQSMLATFQSTTNWAFFSSRMVGLTDAQIAGL